MSLSIAMGQLTVLAEMKSSIDDAATRQTLVALGCYTTC